MLIAENVLEQGLAQVFDGKPAGTSMALADIAIAWNNVGLRKSDLGKALRLMVEQDYLVSHNDTSYLSFALTERGAIRFYICLYCEDSLLQRLAAQRTLNDERSKDASGRLMNRRTAQSQMA